jgi:hypothetical protein
VHTTVKRGGGIRGMEVRKLVYDEPGEVKEETLVLNFFIDCRCVYIYIHIHLYIRTYTNDMHTCAFLDLYMQKIVYDEPRCVYICTHTFVHTYIHE